MLCLSLTLNLICKQPNRDSVLICTVIVQDGAEIFAYEVAGFLPVIRYYKRVGLRITEGLGWSNAIVLPFFQWQLGRVMA
jgi:hypothetical protein